MQRRWHRVLPLIAVVGAVATFGCLPWYGFGDDEAGKVTVNFTDRCEAVSSDGKPVGEFHVRAWDTITFGNKGRRTAVVLFQEGMRWIGRDSVRLRPGERVTLRVRRAASGAYAYRLICVTEEADDDKDEDEEGKGGGPVIVDPPGGGGEGGSEEGGGGSGG